MFLIFELHSLRVKESDVLSSSDSFDRFGEKIILDVAEVSEHEY